MRSLLERAAMGCQDFFIEIFSCQNLSDGRICSPRASRRHTRPCTAFARGVAATVLITICKGTRGRVTACGPAPFTLIRIHILQAFVARWFLSDQFATNHCGTKCRKPASTSHGQPPGRAFYWTLQSCSVKNLRKKICTPKHVHFLTGSQRACTISNRPLS
jgi:hypothetical protein